MSLHSIRVIETTIFTKQIRRLIGDDERQLLLDVLIANPDTGDVIKGSGGCRKLRWGAPGRGKRGGIRVIYYWKEHEIIYMLLAYPKNVKDDLTETELKQLKAVVSKELNR